MVFVLLNNVYGVMSNDNCAVRDKHRGYYKFTDMVLQSRGYGSVQVRRLGGLSTFMTADGREQTADSS
jgi:hypothetical protein